MLVKHFYQLKTYKKFCIQLGKVFEKGFFIKNLREEPCGCSRRRGVLFKKRRVSLVGLQSIRTRIADFSCNHEQRDQFMIGTRRI